MSDYSQQIEEAARKLGTSIYNFESPVSLREKIVALYEKQSNSSNWIWEGFVDQSSIYHEEGVRLIQRLKLPPHIIVFFNKWEGLEMILLKDSSLFTEIILDCYPFEFYLTDENASFLICFNHHRVLIGCGRAKEWIHHLNDSLIPDRQESTGGRDRVVPSVDPAPIR